MITISNQPPGNTGENNNKQTIKKKEKPPQTRPNEETKLQRSPMQNNKNRKRAKEQTKDINKTKQN